jgi:hypothetical protein
LRGEGLAAGFEDFVSKGEYELLASSLVVFFTFIPFFAFREFNRVLGTGKLWACLFGDETRWRRTPALRRRHAK